MDELSVSSLRPVLPPQQIPSPFACSSNSSLSRLHTQWFPFHWIFPLANKYLPPTFGKKTTRFLLTPQCHSPTTPFLCFPLQENSSKRLSVLLSHFSPSLLNPVQAVFSLLHSTEVALVKVTNDIPIAKASGQFSVPILLDLSATFKSRSLLCFTWFYDTMLSWFPPYLTDLPSLPLLLDPHSLSSL